MVPSLPLLSCESLVFVKENADRKKKKKKKDCVKCTFKIISVYNEITFFCFCSKIGSSGVNRVIFFPGPANFSYLDKPGVEFLGVPNSPNLIKMAQKRNRAKRKCHTSFFDFPILDLKLMPIDSELSSAPGNQTHFFLKSRFGT